MVDRNTEGSSFKMARLFQLGMLSILLLTCVAGDICKQCNCTNRTMKYIIDCSNKGLTEIPHDLPSDTMCLDLSSNYIKDFVAGTFRDYNFSNITCLSLSNNKLRTLQSDQFAGLERLEMLDLSLNEIRYNNVDKTAFNSLGTNLIYLDIKQNLSDQQENETYPNEAISKLKNLRTLVIDGLYAQALGQGFSKLTELEEIFFSGHYGRCTIKNMHGGFFENIKASQNFRLYLHNCSIEYVENDTFTNLTNLTTLDLSWNLNLTFKSLPNITRGLSNTNISFLNLNSLHQYYLNDECVKLQEDHLIHLQHNNLTLITLESNNIIGVTDELIYIWPRSVQYLSLRDNLFKLGNYVSILKKNHTLSNLRYFDVAKQFDEHIPPTWKPNNDKIESDSHERENNGGCIIGNSTPLNHCQNMLKRKREFCYFEQILSKVARLQPLKQNTIKLESTDMKSDYMSSTNIIKLEYLDVSDNQPVFIITPLILFNPLLNLTLLNISNNYLGSDFNNNTSVQKYLTLSTVTVFDLSHNGIFELNDNTFDNLTQLKKLYLSGNRLKRMLNLNNLKHLSYLDLNGNIMETIPKSTRYAIDQLNNVTINFANNNIKCNCANLEFLQWMESRMSSGKIHFEDYDTYKCTFDDGSRDGINITRAISKLKNKCFGQTFYVLILVLSLCLLAFILIVSVGLAYRYRWNLRYLYFTTKINLIHGYQPVRNDDTEFEKEVFVSYADEDRGFVREHILPELEERGNVSLLVHDRDFTAGNYVSENIMNAITTTRRTLIVLTKAYLKRKWCLYEFNMAKLEGIETGRNVVCVIMKEEIPLEDIPLGIMDIIKKRTYIEYPQENVHLEGFWERLVEAIKS